METMEIYLHFARDEQNVKVRQEDFQRLMTAVLTATREVATRMEHSTTTEIEWNNTSHEHSLRNLEGAIA
jgi:predicted SprT family Zn-dependent metalloprotease